MHFFLKPATVHRVELATIRRAHPVIIRPIIPIDIQGRRPAINGLVRDLINTIPNVAQQLKPVEPSRFSTDRSNHNLSIRPPISSSKLILARHGTKPQRSSAEYPKFCSATEQNVLPTRSKTGEESGGHSPHFQQDIQLPGTEKNKRDG